MPPVPDFIRSNPKLAFFALLAIAASGFGQTFFIAIFGGALREAFNLSNSWYGASYSAATLLSAFVLLGAGTLIDRWPLRRVATLGVLLLSAGCITLASAQSAWMLLPGFFLLRFAGQGFMTHMGMTTAGRHFTANRGKVIALAALGFPIAEALLPTGGSLMIESSGWRSVWMVSAAVLILAVLPALLWLAGNTGNDPAKNGPATSAGEGDYTRSQVLRDRGFYYLLPATLMTPFVVTAILFHQGAIADERGWSMAVLAGAFGGYAAGHLLALLFAGGLVDRFGAQRSLPMALIPMIAALVLLALCQAPWVPYVYLALVGISQAGTGTAGSALWPERYGSTHLGAIRSVSQASMVFSTAASPLLLGFLLDRGMDVHGIGLLLAGLILVASLLATLAPLTARQRP
ncbi:MFS transporter [Microbulbifer hydrolyticus]|uniref:MFS family permease n=1 Tax=Microbulbifer hydrolyticus TaxID=48074 RepID=A0A6P1TFL5_9GAMM|nr:MFS transporter [Microbulbifer hydrolyticus]MBB5213068.1 MFS family permease [Microbulbifer hydrolyticus]QHQ40425.1 MFS transporter [Microbulbifer hydrolyticus]